MNFLKRLNPFPTTVWVFFFLFLSIGYLVGFVSGSIAVQTNDKKTLEYLTNVKKHRK